MATQIAAGELLGTRHVVRTSTGDLYAVFEDGTKVEVWYSADGSSWAQKDAGNSPDCFANSPVGVAIDSGDILHIVYYHDAYPASGGLDYITFDTLDGGAQDDAFNTEEEAIAQVDADNTRYGCAIAIDSNGKPHAVFTDSDALKGTDYNTIYYANKTGVSWSTPLEVEGVSNVKNCNYPDIAIDSDDKPVVTYINYDDDALGAAQGDANDPTTFSLHDPDTGTASSGTVHTPTIAVDSGGDHWIGYSGLSATLKATLVKHIKTDGWTTWAKYDSSSRGDRVSTAVNGTDVYIIYEDGADNDIKYNKYTGSWAGEDLLEEGTFENATSRWAYLNNYSYTTVGIDYLFKSGTDVYWNALSIGVAAAAPTGVLYGPLAGSLGGPL